MAWGQISRPLASQTRRRRTSTGKPLRAKFIQTLLLWLVTPALLGFPVSRADPGLRCAAAPASSAHSRGSRAVPGPGVSR